MIGDSLDFPAVGFISRTVNFDTPNIANNATVKVGRIPGGAMVYDCLVAVTTAFNGGTTNQILVGTSSNTSQLLSFSSTGTLPTMVQKGISKAGLGVVCPLGGLDVFVQFVQTGTAATTGTARVAVLFVPLV